MYKHFVTCKLTVVACHVPYAGQDIQMARGTQSCCKQVWSKPRHWLWSTMHELNGCWIIDMTYHHGVNRSQPCGYDIVKSPIYSIVCCGASICVCLPLHTKHNAMSEPIWCRSEVPVVACMTGNTSASGQSNRAHTPNDALFKKSICTLKLGCCEKVQELLPVKSLTV